MRKILFLFILAFSTLAVAQSSTSLSAATATGAGTDVAVLNVQQTYTWAVTFATAAPSAQTTNLEGTIDGSNWFVLDTTTTTAAAGEMRHVVYKPVGRIRCNLAAYTQGSNAGVTCVIYQARF